MKPKAAFTCPSCATRLIVPALPDGTFSSDKWFCPSCQREYDADFIDAYRGEYRKAQRQDRRRRVQDSARPKRQERLL